MKSFLVETNVKECFYYEIKLIDDFFCLFVLNLILSFTWQKAYALSMLEGYSGYGAEQGEKVCSIVFIDCLHCSILMCLSMPV